MSAPAHTEASAYNHTHAHDDTNNYNSPIL